MKISLTCIAVSALLLCCNGKHFKKRIQTDDRPKTQIAFMNKLAPLIDDYDVQYNSVRFDKTAEDIKKYALDSLKNVKDWEFIVEEINDNEFMSSEVTLNALGYQPVYNLLLNSVIDNSKIDADTIPINNKINFIITIPKKPKTKVFLDISKKIATLKEGDTVYVSGAITKFNKNLEIDFSEFLKRYYTEYLEIFPLSIKKK